MFINLNVNSFFADPPDRVRLLILEALHAGVAPFALIGVDHGDRRGGVKGQVHRSLLRANVKGGEI